MFQRKYTISAAAILAAFLAVARPAAAAVDADGNSAVVFVYQRIGEDSALSGNLALDQFQDQVDELKGGGYHVLPLSTVVAAMKPGAPPLPPRTVAITFDGASAATMETAQKILDEAGFPFTVFFASDQADAAGANNLSWAQLKALKKDPYAAFGLLPAAYARLVENTPEANAALINRAVAKYREAFGAAPAFFSWPYGEYSAALKKQVAAYGFDAVFGRQSGVVHTGADMLALPRFAMTRDYGDLERFRLTASALPLPVTAALPEDMQVNPNSPPVVGFTVTPQIRNLSGLSCFVSGLGKVELGRPGGNRVEIRLPGPLQDRRTRINCTLPDGKSWRWFGMQLVAPDIPADDDIPSAEDKDGEDQ